ncbi:MAG: hypothetical protein IGR93_00115 [Hydrococcus sp. C42_A2020_068]|uniref:hypothetical protein n=1 Tax=Pleurocapsa sp. PCC 7327 TaxID=118163 RepID=UPI00029FE768|nr:hypothetical protein [Pleurocapsa sp. PCC 7327]AFY78755.1 hypothetical protein Ple7327_3553 [Pleurocapsa sp. PCC 7327]MBF2018539.1 hypothetical protein [Hydrococcus sp. C42_A2020_068]
MINSQSSNFKGRVVFAIGTGRCGTEFISRVINLEPNVSSVHERNPLNETFHRYCKWYGLPVDSEGFLQTKEGEIQQDLENHFFSFEASAHLSLSIQELYDRFNAKFLLLIRSPERVVNSYLQKGWYEKPVIRANPNLAPGYQDYCTSFHHSLGRIMPSGEKFLQWNQMSRIGKIAWYWNALNARVLEQFERIPETHWRIEKLEDLSYSRYLEIAEFFGFQSAIAPEIYEQLSLRRPNAKSRVPTIATWNSTEISEFEAEVEPMAKRFGYEYKVNHLPIPQPQQDSTEQTSLSQLGHRTKKLAVSALKSIGHTLMPNARQEKKD